MERLQILQRVGLAFGKTQKRKKKNTNGCKWMKKYLVNYVFAVNILKPNWDSSKRLFKIRELNYCLQLWPEDGENIYHEFQKNKLFMAFLTIIAFFVFSTFLWCCRNLLSTHSVDLSQKFKCLKVKKEGSIVHCPLPGPLKLRVYF